MTSDATEGTKEQIASVGFWWHSIDVGDGLITPGHKSAAQLSHETELMKLPDLRGKSVLDIGAWDGFFSFEAERRGAKKVVAMDYHAWHSDMDALFKYRKQLDSGGTDSALASPQIWYEDQLPGKRAFDLASKLIDSRVEVIDADFMTVDLQSAGMFDVTFFLGVLYHLKNPLLALERVAALTKDLVIIETEAILLPGFEQAALCEFYEKDELNNDASNWWAPTMPALLGLCRAAGFRTAVAVNHPPKIGKRERLSTALKEGKPIHYRAFVHAVK